MYLRNISVVYLVTSSLTRRQGDGSQVDLCFPVAMVLLCAPQNEEQDAKEQRKLH